MTDITENLYAERDIMAMGNYYMRHVDRMTREGLHAKSDIAAELGFRDMEIDRLRARVAEFDALRQKAAAIDKLARSMVRDWGRREEAGYRFPDTVPLVISARDACAPDDLVRQILGWAD